MRTVLFATTALIASAGFAAAEVSLSGAAQMGIAGDDSEDTSDTRFHTDIDVVFTMTGETDTGLTFGADIDLDEQIGDSRSDSDGFHSGATRDDDAHGGAAMFVSGAFGTLTMGDTDGAFDWAMQETVIGTALRFENEHAGIDGAPGIGGLNAGLDGVHDGQIARYEYAFADFSVAASAELDDDDDGGDPALGLAGRYATEFGGVAVAFGAGIQTITGLDDIDDRVFDDDFEPDSGTIWGLSADATFANGLRVIGNYSDLDEVGGWDHNWSLAAGYEFDALLLAANYGEFGAADGTGYEDRKGWSLTANYDLGGGAELVGAYGNNEFEDGEEADVYSFGISMAF